MNVDPHEMTAVTDRLDTLLAAVAAKLGATAADADQFRREVEHLRKLARQATQRGDAQ